MRFSRIIVLIILAMLFSTPAMAQDGVTLTETEITWQTVAYELDSSYAIVPDSVDSDKLIEHHFRAYVLENEFLKVTLVPEFGGRILSIIYKPTGHEQLYQNPLGLPYGIGDGNFYYDWLMVYGGIFPTFPAPEHGKTWFLPWSFEVISETSEAISVKMSFVDEVNFDRSPSKFNAKATGIEADFIVTLEANRKAVDTEIILRNPTENTVAYEYWTCVTLAPGSNPDDTRVSNGAEIIAPIELIKMPPWWPDTIEQEARADFRDVYQFENLRFFENWADMGIAYAYPNMNEATFWGVINHDNEEGFFRISDNQTTQGLKLWTWGYDSVDIPTDSYSQEEARPYIEMWAGVTPEFFNSTRFAANSEVVIEASYAPTVGLNNVTHASHAAIANFYLDEMNQAQLEVFNLEANEDIRVIITADSEVIYEANLDDSLDFNVISLELAENASQVEFVLMGADDSILLRGAVGEAD